MVDPSESSDVYVVNTCTVTHTADAKARQALNSAHRRNPTALVVGTGCYAHRAPHEVERLDGNTLVVSNPDKEALVEKVLSIYSHELPPPRTGPASPRGPSQPKKSIRRTRSMIKIQEGCDQVCAYCIVPKVRGRERSIPAKDIIDQINMYAGKGYKEVVLTGTQLGTYGFDLEGSSLHHLLSSVLEETSIPRIRISSLQPQEISDNLLALWASGRICPHFHMPLQSGCDATLKRMRRRYTQATYAQAVANIRRSIEGVAITADIIAGFPGETDHDFSESISFARSMEFAGTHIFPYSSRPGTSAAYLGDKVGPQQIKERVGELLSLAHRQAQKYRSGLVGTTRPVLWESQPTAGEAYIYRGLTDNYIKVHTKSSQNLTNQITDGLLLAVQGDGMLVDLESGRPGPSLINGPGDMAAAI